MIEVKDVEHVLVDRDENQAHCFNQVNVRKLRNGELVAVYNEERFPFHHDSGQSDEFSVEGLATWSARCSTAGRGPRAPYADGTAARPIPRG